MPGSQSNENRRSELLVEADAGNPTAFYELGLLAVEEDDDPIEALTWFLRGARAGVLDAQYSVGAMFEQGLGVPEDKCTAFCCYLWVVQREDGTDDDKEMSRDGLQRLTSALTEQQKAGARDRIRIEAEQLFEHVQATFDRILDTLVREISVRKSRATEGDIEAAFELGQIYDRGIGVKKDFNAAAQWYEHAAESGHPEAQFQLGSLYLEGAGVPLDEEIGALWMEAAATRGVPGAQNWLGAHLEGMGRIEEARIWYERAAAHGHSKAIMNIGTMYVNGSLAQGRFDEALLWWNRAVDLKDDEAMLNIGFAYQRGDGVERDLVRALAYFKLALQFSPPAYSMKPYILVVGLTNELTDADRERAEELFKLMLDRLTGQS